MQKNHFRQMGFSLLEMMIVVAMVGLLMALAMPSYRRYTQRAKFTELIHALGPYKASVTLCLYQQNELNECSTPGQNGIPEDFTNPDPQKGYIESIRVGHEGMITATSQRIKLDKKTVFTYTLKPLLQENGSIQWVVDNTLPNSCQRYHLC
jgi:prepilin-type N-terminal cleavage/methylation domain-containing protein